IAVRAVGAFPCAGGGGVDADKRGRRSGGYRRRRVGGCGCVRGAVVGEENSLAGVVISATGGGFQFHSANHVSVAGTSRSVGERGGGNRRTRQASERSGRGRGAINVITLNIGIRRERPNERDRAAGNS